MTWLVAILAAWTVVKVSDGDTVWVKDGGERVKVRLDKIDAPESDVLGVVMNDVRQKV